MSSSCGSKHDLARMQYGLYQGITPLEKKPENSFIRLGRKGIAKHLIAVSNDSNAVRQRIDTLGAIGKYRLKGDSIFIDFDSLYYGDYEVNYKAFNKQYIQRFAVYNREAKYSCVGKRISSGAFACKITEFRTASISYPHGSTVILRPSDTLIVYRDTFYLKFEK